MDETARKISEIVQFGRTYEVESRVQEEDTGFKDGSRGPWDLELDTHLDIKIEETGFGSYGFDTDISELNRVDLGFDRQAFNYIIKISMDNEETELVPSVMDDNLEHMLGKGSLDTTSTAANADPDMMMNEEIEDENNDREEPLEPDEAYSNIEDIKYLIILWRFDQGGGSKIVDLTDNKNSGNILKANNMIDNENVAEIWENGELEAGDPLEFEDEWGKNSPPNWALQFDGTQSLRVRGSKGLAKLKGHFSYQVWIKIEEFKEFVLFKRQAEDFNA
jgi:hypothetical protein